LQTIQGGKLSRYPELNCNSLKNFSFRHQFCILHRLFHLKSFAITNLSAKTAKVFHLKWFYDAWHILSFGKFMAKTISNIATMYIFHLSATIKCIYVISRWLTLRDYEAKRISQHKSNTCCTGLYLSILVIPWYWNQTRRASSKFQRKLFWYYRGFTVSRNSLD